MSPIGTVHLIFSLIAIAAGGWVLLIRKGTRWHRTLGHVYAMSMAGVVVTAFSIYGMNFALTSFLSASSRSSTPTPFFRSSIARPWTLLRNSIVLSFFSVS